MLPGAPRPALIESCREPRSQVIIVYDGVTLYARQWLLPVGLTGISVLRSWEANCKSDTVWST